MNIVVMSDGADSCGGDPCRAAAVMKAELPYANVIVVSLARGASANACVAEQTGGLFVEALDNDTLFQAIRASVGRLDRDECLAGIAEGGPME